MKNLLNKWNIRSRFFWIVVFFIFSQCLSYENALANVLKDPNLIYQERNDAIIISSKPKQDSEETKQKILTQTIRGQVIDEESKLPLIGVTVMIEDSSPPIGATTNIDGNFRIEKVPVGRVNLQLSYIGYEQKIIPNIVVNSAKVVVLNLTLHEYTTKMDEVTVVAQMDKGSPINDMALVDARSISPEESNRYAGPFNDPTRILSNYAGIATTQDGSNDIIVRGNSPKYVQWRLEGVQITNPNHFANQSGIGTGGISALNNNMLATSDFYTSAFPAEYGDVLSGVYDIKLRSGNNERFEGVFGVGIMGTDITLEGPLKKGYAGSYLINYRYSTITLLSTLGLLDRSGATNFQDGAFKIMLPSDKLGTFSIFGLGGFSGFDLENISGIDAVLSPGFSGQLSSLSKDHSTRSYLFNTGINHSIYLSKKSYLNTSVIYSTDGINDNVQARYNPPAQAEDSPYQYFEGDVNKSTYRGAMTFNYKFNNRHKLQAGFKYAYFSYDYFQQLQKDTLSTPRLLADFDEQMSTLRNFISWKFQAFSNVTFITGIHQMNDFYNQNRTLEPRFAMDWRLTPNIDLTLGYGKHSTMESAHNYFAKVPNDNGTLTEPNRNLGLLKADHYTLAIEKRFRPDLKAKLGIYYQWLYDLPVAKDSSYYATINERIDYEYVHLVNEGEGKNYGVELTIEKFFNNSYYFLVNMSLFQSKYKTLENKWRNTQYNSEYIANILAGKEFLNLGRKDNQALTINLKVFVGGGRKIIPLRRDDQGQLNVDPANDQYWDYDKAYESSLDDLHQIDFSMSYKWNRPKTTHEFYLNIYDITEAKGRISEYYDDSEPGNISYITQVGLFPNLMYKVYF
ncbi:TonB-dependent receptor [Owenweeksia hongkongensis]|uniref:TonB-dependent receptor n=1 Tax=Owenweeksia hongkongensis TaxID=253245 RepID=UPI001CB8E284|nr:TonB-dependent receptor [Owenweeksia hongkongensis]